MPNGGHHIRKTNCFLSFLLPHARFSNPFHSKPFNFLLSTLLTQTFKLRTIPLLPNHYKFITTHFLTSQSFPFTILFSKHHNIFFLFLFPSFKMPHKAVRARGDMDYMGISFAEGIDGENQRNIYHKLFKRDVLETRYPDNVALCDLGLSDSVHWMLNNLGMSHFLTLISPTFIQLTYEFLSSFRYTTPIGGSRTTDTAYFRMSNRSYAINQDQLADLLSFPHGDEFACQHPLESEWKSSALDFWQQLTGKPPPTGKALKLPLFKTRPFGICIAF